MAPILSTRLEVSHFQSLNFQLAMPIYQHRYVIYRSLSLKTLESKASRITGDRKKFLLNTLWFKYLYGWIRIQHTDMNSNAAINKIVPIHCTCTGCTVRLFFNQSRSVRTHQNF